MYDFANSAFATTVCAVVFNVYFVQALVPPGGARVGSWVIPGEALWGYTLSLTMLILAFTAPLLGAVADFSATKKKFLFIYCTVGALATGMLFFAKPGDWVLGTFLFAVAYLGFAGGNAFYNAFLPELSPATRLGEVSGKAWAWGYLGGGLCLTLNLFMINRPEFFGFPKEEFFPVRASTASVGLWWAFFAVPTFLWVKEQAKPHSLGPGESLLAVGFKRLKTTFQEARRYRELAKFLLAYLIYNDGIETVILMAAVFGAQALGMGPGELVACFLLIQFVGFGAPFFLENWPMRGVTGKL